MMASPAATDRSERSGTDLLSIVGINEEIKRVVGVTFKINIMALNAIFLAKRAGTSALGFGVLSNELRVFSQDLRNSMQALTSLVHACVTEVSRSLQDRRYIRLLQEAARLAPQSRLDDSIARRVGYGEEEGARLDELRRRLRRALEDAFKLVELGGVLAKSAKIEAAYGQGFAAALTQVSGEFDGVVEEIRHSLQALRKSRFFSGN
jgi:methyl-accepting chemotaxis protein